MIGSPIASEMAPSDQLSAKNVFCTKLPWPQISHRHYTIAAITAVTSKNAPIAKQTAEAPMAKPDRLDWVVLPETESNHRPHHYKEFD